MRIRGWERTTLLTAVSAVAVLGLAACGPTSEPTGDETAPDVTASETPGADSPTPEEPATDNPAADDDAPEGETGGATASTQPSPEKTSAEPEGGPGSKTPGAAPGKDDNEPSLCDAADLNGSIKQIRGGGAAGSVYRGLVLTNASDQPCVLKGFPGVSYVDASGNQIGAPADRDTSTPSPAIDLAAGESAMATLQQTRAENYGNQCDQKQASGLRVYPPSAYDSLIIEQQMTACTGDDIVLMTIGAFQPVK